MVVLPLIVSMGVILFLVSKKMNMGYALMIGAILLALFSGRGFPYIFQTFLSTLLEYETITLALTVGLITVLGYVMEKYMILDRMVTALEKMLRSAKATILVAPTILGILLVTGGALMSCPVVETLGNRLDISRDKRAAINLIFRHALYFVFPMSTTMILAAQLGDYNIWDFIKLQFPIAVALYVFGYLFYLRDRKESTLEKIAIKEYLVAAGEFLVYSSPILVSLLGAIALNMPFYISLVLGIIVSILIYQYDKGKNPEHVINESLWKTLYDGVKIPMIIAIIGVMIFKNVINDMDEIYVFLNSLLDRGIPVELLIFIASGLISFPLATTQAGIAILFPMILPMAPTYEMKLLYAMFIYTTSFMFYYISPLHLCQVLTLEYFEVKLKDLYKNYMYIIPLAYLVMLIVYFVNK